MQITDEILAIYEANKVDGRSQFCPRKGFYKIVSVYQDQCLKKQATMAKAYWKLNNADEYTSQLFIVQIESLKKNLKPLDTENLIGHELEIVSAEWFKTTGQFSIDWNLLPKKQVDLDELNKQLLHNFANFDLEQNDILPDIAAIARKEADYVNL